MVVRTWARRSVVGGCVLAALSLALTGCGEGRQFTAEEFIDEVREQGVEIELGDELLTEGEDKELYAIELPQVADLPEDAGAGGEDHTAGSISIYEDVSGADDEIETCQVAADLLCYQASNVVVVLEGGGIESQQLALAIERIAEE